MSHKRNNKNRRTRVTEHSTDDTPADGDTSSTEASKTKFLGRPPTRRIRSRGRPLGWHPPSHRLPLAPQRPRFRPSLERPPR